MNLKQVSSLVMIIIIHHPTNYDPMLLDIYVYKYRPIQTILYLNILFAHSKEPLSSVI